MKKLLWLDDLRNPVDYVVGDYDISWVKNYEQFCTFINENGLPDIICFDHDLGEEKSGYDCAKFVVWSDTIKVQYLNCRKTKEYCNEKVRSKFQGRGIKALRRHWNQEGLRTA